MGYYINLKESNFRILKENMPKALAALVKLGDGKDDPRAGGGSDTVRHYSWMNLAEPEKWQNLADAMKEWRYPIRLDGNGDCVAISFKGEKIGQEEIMFDAIAPFIEDGSYLHMIGEDGDQWRWSFDGGKCRTQTGRLNFS